MECKCIVDKKRNRLKLFLVIVICTLVMVLGYYDNIVQYNDTVDKMIQNELNYGSNLLKVIINENLDKSQMSNENTIKSVQDKVDKSYDNSNILKADLVNIINGLQYNSILDNILSDSIRGYYLNDIINDNNDKFWMSKNYIISDLSYNCSINGDNSVYRSFDDEIRMHYNSDLAKIFMDNIKSQEVKDIQFWCFLPNKYGIKYQVMDVNRVINVYKSYRGDLNSIDNIEFLKPTYMYQRVDILGNELVKNGVRNDDIYQLILVQGFNVVDIIDNNPQYSILFSDIVNNIEQYEADRISKFSHLSIMIFLIIIVVIGGFIILAMDYNNQLDKMEKEIKEIDRKE